MGAPGAAGPGLTDRPAPEPDPRQGTWRTPESTLHAIDLAGGWPGALVARRVFRHKTTKQPFRTVFWLTVTVNCAALAWFVSDGPTVLF